MNIVQGGGGDLEVVSVTITMEQSKSESESQHIRRNKRKVLKAREEPKEVDGEENNKTVVSQETSLFY